MRKEQRQYLRVDIFPGSAGSGLRNSRLRIWVNMVKSYFLVYMPYFFLFFAQLGFVTIVEFTVESATCCTVLLFIDVSRRRGGGARETGWRADCSGTES